MTKTCMICDEHGYPLSEGLQHPDVCDEAHQIAQHSANERGKTVYLYIGDDPDPIEVEPERLTYEVLASNCGFYQTLRVNADSRAEAAKKFRKYLSDEDNQRDENDEYESWLEYDPSESRDRDDFRYDFDDADIKSILDFFGSPVTDTEYDTVQMIESGRD